MKGRSVQVFLNRTRSVAAASLANCFTELPKAARECLASFEGVLGVQRFNTCRTYAPQKLATATTMLIAIVFSIFRIWESASVDFQLFQLSAGGLIEDGKNFVTLDAKDACSFL